ncbi:DUF6493 family protein [Streptomyces sp. NPDC088789]|uniref:DUF7824 domain-containing protein n=1 Tax=Streptomyces sp. NPDC088789 TaxID=3365899 RepID=UPI00382B56ED
MIRKPARFASKAKLMRFRHEAGKDPSGALLNAVEAGAIKEIPVLLADLDDAARRALLPRLKELRSQTPPRPDTARAAHLAGAACHSGPVACAAWLARSRRYLQDPHLLVSLLAERPPEFLATVTERLSTRADMGVWGFILLRALADASGTELPVTEATATWWEDEAYGKHYKVCRLRTLRLRRGQAPAPEPDPATPCGGLLTVLREDPLTPRMVPFVLDDAARAAQLAWRPCRDSAHPEDSWHGAFAVLAAEGLLDRTYLLTSAVAVLLRGTHPLPAVRFCVALLRALEPTAEERAARTGDWIRLAADAPSPAAGYAQEVLRDLWDTGRLSPARCAEASRAVFFRTEKKLVRTQLSWLDAAMKGRPAHVPLLLPALGDVFAHPDTGLQQRALRLAGRHLAHADRAAREELLTAAHLLGPGLLATAAEVFDTPELVPGPGPAGGHRDSLPEPRTAPRMPEPPGSAEEFVAEFAAVLAADLRGRASAASYEWALDGLVRLAHRDRALLAKALEPVARRHNEWVGRTEWLRHGGRGLLLALAAATGSVEPSDIRKARRAAAHTDCRHARLGIPWRHRLTETALALAGGEVPPLLLATPSRESGELDPEELLDRLRVYAGRGAAAGPVDLGLALLRLRPPADPAPLVAGARALGTPAGERLADWLESPRAPLPTPERTLVAVTEERRRLELEQAASPRLAKALPAVSALAGGYRRSGRWCGCVYAGARYWVSMLPGEPDAVALHLIPVLADSAVWTDRPDTGLLLTLAETPGPAGPALHLALAYGLSVRHADDRLAVVDALLALAGRGALDPALLGAELAGLMSLGAVKPTRVADALGTLANAGAPATAWAVLAALLPPLLTAGDPPPRGTGDLLATAATSVETSGARGTEPWLADLAARRGTSRLLTETRRLHQALTRT